MKKNILANIRVLAILVACLTVLGVGDAWGTTATLTLKTSSGPSSPYEDANGVTWTFSGVTFANSNNACIDKTSGTLTITPPSGATVTQISVTKTGNAWSGDAQLKFFVGTSGTAHTTLTSSSSTTTNISITSTDQTAGSYKFTNTTSKNCWVESITITYTPVAQTITFDKQGGTFDDPSVFINTNQIKEASGGAGITLPLVNPSSACASEGWGFYGWATAAVGSSTTTAPTIVGKAGDTYYPSSSRTLYAVFAQGEYTKETSAITAGGKYLIVANSGGHNYVMTNTYSTYEESSKTYGQLAGVLLDETSSNKYSAASINPKYIFTIVTASSVDVETGDWMIKNVEDNKYVSVDYQDLYLGLDEMSEGSDGNYIRVTSGTWKITNYYSSEANKLYFDSSDKVFKKDGTTASELLIYKAGTINYWSTPSCCDKAVTLSAGTKTNVSTIEFSETSVATCGDQASRSVTVTVTTNSGYEMTGDLSFSKSSGTATATKSTGPTGTGPYTYVYYFNQNDNGAGSFAATASAKSYTVTLNDNNGSGGSGSKSVTFNSNTNMTSAVAIPERTHYIFGGYWTSANSGATLDTKIIDTDGTWVASVSGYTDATPNWIKADNVTLYAKWTEHTYTNYRTTCSSTYDIVLDKNGGDADGSAKVDANATKLKSISAPTKTGYKVEGYYAESGKTNLVAAIDGTLDEDVEISSDDWTDGDGKWVKGSGATLYAGWEANTYTISLDNESPTEEGSTSVTLTYDSNSHDGITNPTKTGYTFGGWYSSDNGTGELVIDASGDLQENVEVSDEGWTDASGNWIYDYEVTLYAKWTANSYTVTLDNNDATSGSQQTVSATYDAAMPLKTTADGTPAVAALSRTGYTFTGWWDATSGGTQYYSYDGSSIASANNWDKTSATTLKAQWSINSYTLTWSWGGGSTSSSTHTAAGSVAYGTTLVYPGDATMSKTGYTFTGWSSTPSTMPATNTTITAQWSINNYNVAVLANSHVTITANTTIEEGGDDDVTYATTVTLNYDELGDGLTWGGWRVYKADDASTTVSVSGSGDGATFSMPAYDVKVEAIVYSVGIAWCDPDVTVTGDVHLTSTKDVYVHSTSGAGNLISISSSDMGSATKMEVGYLDENEDEVDKAESPFRLYNSTASSTIDEEDLDYGWDVNYSLRYTPTDYSQLHNYKLQLTFKRGDKVLKTVTHAIYGRSLPEEFVIAVKNTNDSKWYALPSNLASTKAAQGVIALNPALEIEVDNTTTPTKATIAPSTRIHKAMGRATETNNMYGIRFTTTGSNKMQAASDVTYVWLPTDNADNSQVWQLASSNLQSYTVTMPTIGSKKLGIFANSGDKFGYAATPHSYGVYFLPVETKIDELEATADDWTQHDVLVEANASSVEATKVLGVLGATTSDKETVPTPVAENTYLLKLDGDLDYVDKDGQTLQLKWYDSSDELKAYSWVTVPSIITAGTKTTWKALEDSLTTSTTLNDIVVLSKPMTVGEAHAKAKKIVMDQSGDNTGKLTIQPSKGLEVASTVKVYNGTNFVATGEADLVLESSSSDGNASLIFDNSNACQATVQMYSKAAIVGNTWKWQYVGTPFTGSIPAYNYYGSWMYKWDKTDGWLVVHGGDELTPFAGYCLTQESATTHVMGGTLVASDGNNQTIAMGANTDMVLANSWTAPIWIGGFKTEGEGATFTSEPATIYMFNTGSAENGSSAGTAEAGTYEAIPINSAPFTGDGLIPSMQGFFVTTQPEGGSGKAGTITLKYDELVRPNNDRDGVDPNIITTGPMYAPKRVDKPEVMKIMANGSKYSDRVVLLERADFSSGFDNGWDGEKLSFGVEGPSVYVINGQGKYDAVSAIPSFEGTVVGFRSGTDNSCTISFEYDGNETLYLNDLKMQQSTPIDTVHTYTFSTASSDNEARFIISATPITAVTTGFESSAVSGQSSEVRKVLIGSQIYIIRGGRMFSAEGQMVK